MCGVRPWFDITTGWSTLDRFPASILIPRPELVEGRLRKVEATMLRVVFMGTPEFAVPTLAAIAAAGHQVAAVYTQPPRPAGRGMQERKSRDPSVCRRGRHPRAHASDPQGGQRAACLRRPASGCRRRRRLRPDPAEAGARCAARRAASTCTPRPCRAGAARHRSSAPSWPATPRRRRPSCAWTRGWIPGRFAWRSACRSGRTRPPANCTICWRSAAPA